MVLTINALQLFDEVYLSTKGGPLNATTCIVYYLYSLAFQGFAGYAAAIAYVLLVAILSLTLAQLWVGRRLRVLRVMTAQILAQTGRPAQEEKEREAGRFLFSPWHLVLIPIAVLMLIPMAWMLVTSLETLNETRHFPPVLLPHTLAPGNYAEVLRQAPFARWFLNTRS